MPADGQGAVQKWANSLTASVAGAARFPRNGCRVWSERYSINAAAAAGRCIGRGGFEKTQSGRRYFQSAFSKTNIKTAQQGRTRAKISSTHAPAESLVRLLNLQRYLSNCINHRAQPANDFECTSSRVAFVSRRFTQLSVFANL